MAPELGTTTHHPWWERVLVFFTRIFWICLAAITLVALWISLSGRWHWHQIKEKMLAHGEKFTMVELAPPPQPDEGNFFADPIWITTAAATTPADLLKQKPDAEEIATLRKKFPAFAGLPFDNSRTSIVLRARKLLSRSGNEAMRRDYPAFVLTVLAPLTPLLARINDLLQRPHAWFPLNYADGIAMKQPHVSPLLTLGQAFYLRAEAEIELGQNEAACRDTVTIVHLSRTISTEPDLISYLVRASLLAMVVTPIDQGIKTHQWTDPELVLFEHELQREDLLPGFALALRG